MRDHRIRGQIPNSRFEESAEWRTRLAVARMRSSMVFESSVGGNPLHAFRAYTIVIVPCEGHDENTRRELMLLQPTRVIDWLPIIRRTFEEVSELRLTAEQASLRWNMEASQLEAMLDAFVAVGVLSRSSDGVYARRTDRLAA